MTYENDPNRRRGMRDETSYTGWIVGGAVALALILGIFFMTSGPNNYNTASNTTSPAATSRPAPAAPSTTGQRSEPIQPNNPAGNVPTAPASAR
jgi:hypothetical protein